MTKAWQTRWCTITKGARKIPGGNDVICKPRIHFLLVFYSSVSVVNESSSILIISYPKKPALILMFYCTV